MITVGIGCAKDFDKILSSAANCSSEEVKVVIYAKECDKDLSNLPGNVEIRFCDKPEQSLAEDLYFKRIDGAVRGTLPANDTLAYLKKVYNVGRLERIALLETADGDMFFFAPVGVDEGRTVEEKISLVNEGRKLAKAFGFSDKTAVLSGGRMGDIGRDETVDKTIIDAQKVAEATGADHAEILIEDAVKKYSVIIAPDGISGNLVFRTLSFLGHGHGHGAPIVNISGNFVDSSRASSSYETIINLTVSIARKNNSN